MKTVALCSGGIDSTVLMYHLLADGHEVVGFSVDYGQAHRRELAAAADICSELGIPYRSTVLDPELFAGSELTGGTGVVVPNRNMVMIALAGAVALRASADYVAVACHQGDYGLFPDCRPTFLEEAFRALRKACGVGLLYPFAYRTKLEVVALGLELGVPFERTWSCYRGGAEPCGECLACRERQQALFLAGALV